MKKSLKYIILTSLFIMLAGFLLKGRIPYERFDSEKWKDWKETESSWSLRWDMMNSLRNQHDLKGKSKEEIIHLLGEPESKSNSKFYYYLGMAKHGIDTGSLQIFFDKNSIVRDFIVIRS